MALIKHELEQIKICQLYESIFSSFQTKTRNIQANRSADALLIKSVLSCKTSLHWEYKCNMEHKWTKRMVINNGWDFQSHGRAWMNLFSAKTSPHTSTKPLQCYTAAGSYLGFSFIFFRSSVYLNHCIYQHLSESFYMAKSRKVITMQCLKNWSLHLNIARLLICIRSKKSVSCVFLRCIYLFKSLFRRYSYTWKDGRQTIMTFEHSELYTGKCSIYCTSKWTTVLQAHVVALCSSLCL